MTLRQPRDHLAMVVAAWGGTWKEAADGRTVEATFPEKGTRYRIRFAKDTGLSREISEIGALESGPDGEVMACLFDLVGQSQRLTTCVTASIP